VEKPFERFYDLHKKSSQVLVTGSARLDFFKKSGDYLLLEVKSNESAIAPSTYHFYNQTKPKFAFQVVRDKRKVKAGIGAIKSPIELIYVEDFLSALI
jgi:hypothetical protein